ncbi:hypothetical protein, partial [Escherichia coli]
MRVAEGALGEWASTASNQCDTGRASTADGYADIPRSATDYTVRVEVCDASSTVRESFCRKYNDGITDRFKPAGLLQTYGESGRL